MHSYFFLNYFIKVDLQAQARAHRIGQKREVLVLRLETVCPYLTQIYFITCFFALHCFSPIYFECNSLSAEPGSVIILCSWFIAVALIMETMDITRFQK